MKYTLLALVCFAFHFAYSQPDTLFIKKVEEKYVGPQWVQKNKISIDLSEVAFVNWSSGGSNSISGLLGFETSANYSDQFFSWRNSAVVRYGINKQESRELRKTDDKLEIISNLGYKPNTKSNWYYSVRFSFNTQLTNGYNYPDTDNPISSLMAPGYLFFGGGTEYGKDIDKVSLYFSPLTLKATFVLDEDLANAGSFGVTPAVYDDDGNLLESGERVRKEVGILLTNTYEMEVMKNVNLKNNLSLYSDYINNFGNVDVDWSLDFDFKVNQFIKASFGSHIKYDDDVKTQVESETEEGEYDEAGAKVQWKQYLGVGFAVSF